jgi:hypothetical protein
VSIDGFDTGVLAGDPVVLRRFLEAIAMQHDVEITWTSDRGSWRSRRGHVFIPPPIDKTAAAIGLHELSHNIAGPCPRSGVHRAKDDGRTLQCLECERRAWDIAVRLVPFDREMHQLLRQCLSSYRRSLSAPASVQRESDRLMGTVSWAQRQQSARRWQDRLNLVAQWNASVERDRERRRTFEQLEARVRAWRS